jgi:hypothetical protein
MQQTISREERTIQDQRAAKTGPSGGEFSVKGISKENHASDGYLGATLERFLQMPIAVVLPVLWVVGMALLSSGVLTLYALGTLLASVVAGA